LYLAIRGSPVGRFYLLPTAYHRTTKIAIEKEVKLYFFDKLNASHHRQKKAKRETSGAFCWEKWGRL